MTATEVLERSRHGEVLLLCLTRPQAANAISGELALALHDALDRFEEDPELRVAVLTGSGDRIFSAGADLREVETGHLAEVAGHLPSGFAGITERDCPKPLIAAVNGAAIAGGFEIVLSCDLVVAEEHATFGLPEVARGLIAGAGGAVRVPQRLPHAVAHELLLTGDPIDAHRAQALGLVNHVVPRGQAVDEALRVAQRIVANAPLAIEATLAVTRAVRRGSDGDAWRTNHDQLRRVQASDDVREGTRAFLEKRPPAWSGR